MRVAFLLAVFATTAYAEVTLESCLGKAITTSEISVCYGQESERQDAKLKVAMDDAIRLWAYSREFESNGWSKEQIDGLKRNLRNSQIAWNEYRNAWCHFRADTINGTGSAIMFSQCLIQMNTNRLSEIASR
jgi:uncharacterized protein YecT (DUF1311 family)